MRAPSRAPASQAAAGAPSRAKHFPERDQTQYTENWREPHANESTDPDTGVTRAVFESFRLRGPAVKRALLSRFSDASLSCLENLATRLSAGEARVAGTMRFRVEGLAR